MDLIAARNYTRAARGSVRLICIHSMEAPEKPGTARAVAKWFAGPLAPQASAHYCVDALEVVQCVRDEDVAWAAPGANRDGLHIELAGYASQTAADWSDAYSTAELQRAAKLCAELALKWVIPIQKLTVEQVRDTRTKGFCGHIDVTHAFPKIGTHTDPGANFPWDHFLALVESAMVEITEPTNVA